MIDQVKKEVYEVLNNDKSGHNMEHINRVYDLSIKFAIDESANIFLTSLIALLHDVDDYKLFGTDTADNLTNARRIMNNVGIEENVQIEVLKSIKSIGYKKSLMGIRPTTLEGMIVSDADMCDCIGVNGILRIYDYQKQHGKPFFDRNTLPNSNLSVKTYGICADSAVCHCFDKLLRLKSLMMTKSGMEEAASRHDIVVSMLCHLFAEENAPEWKEYLDKFLSDLYPVEGYARKR